MFSPDGRRLVFTSVDRPENPDFRGKCVLVWNTVRNVSAITGATGRPVGWHDACVSGVDNGTTFAPVMSDKTQNHPYYVLFTVAQRNGFCNMVLRDLNGDDIPVDAQVNNSQLQILEPSISSAGTYLAWDVASKSGDPPAPQQVYVCVVAQCTDHAP